MLKITNFVSNFHLFKVKHYAFARTTSIKQNKSVFMDLKKTVNDNTIQTFSTNSDDNKINSIEHAKINIINNEEIENQISNKKKNFFNFESFKKRNKEINNKQKHKEHNLITNNKLEDDLDSTEGKDIDKSLIDQLKKYIQEDEKTQNSTEKFNKNLSFDKDNLNEVKEYNEFESKYDGMLVQRPPKGFVWGMGHQTNKKKYKFETGQIPSVQAIVKYLEASNLKDIVVVPTNELGFEHLKETSIVSVGFSSKHIYKSAKDLSVEIKNLEIEEVSDKMIIYGRRDEEWLLLEIGPEISVYFLTDAFNKEVDLVGMWTNPLSPEDIRNERNLKYSFYKKRFSKF